MTERMAAVKEKENEFCKKVAYIYETFSLFFILFLELYCWPYSREGTKAKWGKEKKRKSAPEKVLSQEKPSSIYEAVGNEKGRKPYIEGKMGKKGNWGKKEGKEQKMP